MPNTPLAVPQISHMHHGLLSECDRDVPSGCFERPSYLMQNRKS